jgi:hypothetical protein
MIFRPSEINEPLKVLLSVKRRDNIKPFLQAYQVRKICEIGVWNGYNLKTNFSFPELDLCVAIDPWGKNSTEDPKIQKEDNKSFHLIWYHLQKLFLSTNIWKTITAYVYV